VSSVVTTRSIGVGRHRIFVREAGSGPMVLLLHGWPETSYSWRKQMGALSEAGYHAVAIDGIGYGRSSRPPHIHDYRISELVTIAVGVVAAMGERTATVVGHDWGALVAWTAAWIHPEVFTAVVGLSVPFAGRGLMAMPSSPFGEVPPSAMERELAGPDRLFYTEYFDLVGRAEQEFDEDVRGWLRDLLYSASASIYGSDDPLPDTTMSREDQIAFVRQSVICLAPGARLRDGLLSPEVLPDWLSEDELEHYVADFERTGMWGALNWYRCMDINWEILAPYEHRKVEVPALYVAADRDMPWVWARQNIDQMGEWIPDLRGQVLLNNCGHWMQQEVPDQLNAALVGFLDEVSVDLPTRV
jgi:pimeloyl-ACP methyl ester carboxylesterase